MADYPDKTRAQDTYVRDTRYVEAPRESSGTLWFIVGGVVVALGIIFAVMYGGADTSTGTAPAGGSDTSVTIDNSAPPPADAAAPADQAAPPADDAAPAPAPEAEPAPAAPAADGN